MLPARQPHSGTGWLPPARVSPTTHQALSEQRKKLFSSRQSFSEPARRPRCLASTNLMVNNGRGCRVRVWWRGGGRGGGGGVKYHPSTVVWLFQRSFLAPRICLHKQFPMLREFKAEIDKKLYLCGRTAVAHTPLSPPALGQNYGGNTSLTGTSWQQVSRAGGSGGQPTRGREGVGWSCPQT